MWTCIEERKVKAARKDHSCDACTCLTEGDYRNNKWTFAEYRAIAKAKANNWMIKKGEPYIRQRNTDGYDIGTFKAIPAIYKICAKYNLFDDY